MAKLDIKKDWTRVLTSSLIGAVAAAAISAALVTALAGLVSSGRVGEDAEKAICVISVFAATAAGAFIARLRAGGAGLLTGIGTAVIVIMAKIILTLLSDESTALDGTDITLILCILCAGVASGAISPHKRRRKRR